MNAIQLFNQSVKKNMVRWDEKDFIKTYPKLYKTIIEAIEKGMEEVKAEPKQQSCKDWTSEVEELIKRGAI